MDGGFEPALHIRTQDVLDRCTACGACAEVCPMPGAGRPRRLRSARRSPTAS